jgi:hypothetical protein
LQNNTETKTLGTNIDSPTKISLAESMSSGPIYRQLVLFDGTDDRAQLFNNVKGLSEVPSNCDFQIFCNENNIIDESSLKDLKSASHVRVHKSSNPVAQLLDILHKTIYNYLFIFDVGDEKAMGGPKLDKIKKDHNHIYIINTNPSNVTIESILEKVRRCQEENRVTAMISNDSRFFGIHQCPQCSQSFKSIDLLQKHSDDEHLSVTSSNVHLDYEAKILHNKRNDQNQPELNCIPCNQGFQTLEARDNHTKKVHPDALANSEEEMYE